LPIYKKRGIYGRKREISGGEKNEICTIKRSKDEWKFKDKKDWERTSLFCF